MRVTLLILLVLVVGLASCQEGNRRARLRSLISRARKGDAEARSTLRELRQKLKQRRNEATSSQKVQEQQPIQPTTFHPTTATPTTTTTTTPQPPPTTEPTQRVLNEFPLFSPTPQEPIQAPAISRRLRPRQRVTTFDSHRAINRGLEVSSRTEQLAQQSDLTTGSRRAEQERPAPVQTTRRYAYFDDAGNYIFGYEAADGSFKEEIRGKDCVVHGKYGYIDPDGVRREFSYVSGNRCDPNAPPDAELVEAPPLNDQFLQQTRARKLTTDEMNTFKQARRRPAQRRRKPQRQQPVEPVIVPQQPRLRPVEPAAPVITQQEREQPSFVQQAPVRPSGVSSRFPPFPGTKTQAEKEPTSSRFPPFPATQKAEPKVVASPLKPKPTPAPQTPRPTPLPSPTPFPSLPQRPPQTVVRPNPNAVTFDFDKEFSGLFTNFPATRRFHQPTPAPVVRPAPTTPDPFILRDFSQLRSADPNEPHQLVYDAASRTFKTVPLHSLVTIAPNNGKEPPTLKPFKPKNPLPPVPLGGLTFGNSGNKMSAKEFDNFFKNIELIVKTEPL